jgi:hypothetical protein
MAWIDVDQARRLLMGDDEHSGLFEEVLGFRPSTYAIKVVHLMNDLSQNLLGGAPASGGDFLCRVIREDKEGEGNSEEELRADPIFGPAFNRAFPRELGSRRISRLRAAIGLVLNYDKGIYQPGTAMASALATHGGLLGFEGFRRFRLGSFLKRCLNNEGQRRLVDLLKSDRDPITRVFRPLLLDEEFVDKQPSGGAMRPTRFDEALGRRLNRLLTQPLTKPTLLRSFALGASLGIVLKILGVGREGGRPLVLALMEHHEAPSRPLREEAVQAFQRGRDALDQYLATRVIDHQLAAGLFHEAKRKTETDIEVRGSGTQAALQMITSLRTRQERGEKELYWPDRFAMALGRKAGCILPLHAKAGWGSHVALTPELVEVVTLMSVEPGGRPEPWAKLWRDLREDLGLVIGANPTSDADALRVIGVAQVSPQKLLNNATALLAAAVRRGAAHRLPDGGAEAVGTLA